MIVSMKDHMKVTSTKHFAETSMDIYSRESPTKASRNDIHKSFREQIFSWKLSGFPRKLSWK